MRKLILLYSICIALFTACGNSVVSPEQIEKYPSIYPDYIGVTIPATIAPMNFSYTDTSYERIDGRVFLYLFGGYYRIPTSGK